jgi:hypothetical protein
LASDGRSRGPRDRLDVDGPPLRPHTLTPTICWRFATTAADKPA